MKRPEFTGSGARGEPMAMNPGRAGYDIKARIPNTLHNLGLTTTAVKQGRGDQDACALTKVFAASAP